MDGEQVPVAGLPYATVSLPGGQIVDVRVLRRRRDRRGVWWYDVVLEVPDRVDTPHGPVQEVRQIFFSAPHPVVQPLPGQDYSAHDPPPPEDRKRWRVSERVSGRGPDLVVHRLDCAQGAHSQQVVTDREALRLLADPEQAVTCSTCRPGAVLKNRRAGAHQQIPAARGGASYL
ncbi:DUF6233 domain-containing protein [Streptomyces syringium]|uniref:DUF6233 domain-containing protein n=1 Tax=Streptomyces syringium TaxID=76729 RepID=UPI003D89BA73